MSMGQRIAFLDNGATAANVNEKTLLGLNHVDIIVLNLCSRSTAFGNNTDGHGTRSIGDPEKENICTLVAQTKLHKNQVKR